MAQFTFLTFRNAADVLPEPDKYLRAFFSFKDRTTDIVYNGWRLLEGQYGLYVAPPQKAYTYTDENGNQQKGYEKFVDRASTTNEEGNRVYTERANEWWNALTEEASAKFQSGTSSAPREKKAPAKAAASSAKKTSGRGPAKKTVVEDDEDLPF